MATLTIRNVPDEIHERLKVRAERNRRSLNSEAVLLLEQAIETLPDEAELRARYLESAARAPGAAGDGADYDRAPSPLVVLRETATDRGLEAREVLELFAEQQARLRSLGVRRIGLFGSVLRGESGPESDVEVLVELDPARKSFDALVELASWLETLIGREVELLTTEGLTNHRQLSRAPEDE